MNGPRRQSQQDVTFAEAQGIPANEHAKKLAKEKSKHKQQKYDSVYSSKDQKVLKITVKPNGVYTEYVGSLSKKKPEAKGLVEQIAIWKKDGLWIESYALKDYCSKQIEKLNS